jgi:Icc protein
LRVGSRWLDSVGLQNGDDLFAVTDRYPSVRAVVFGHVHQQFEGERNGVQVLGVPSTCAQFLPGAEQFAVDPAPAGCRALELRADGTLGTQVLRTSAHQAAPLLAAASG